MAEQKPHDATKPDQSPSEAAKSPRMVLTRGPEVAANKSKKQLMWAVAALSEFDEAQSKVVKALRSQAAALSSARGATTITEVEVRDALRRMVIGLPKSRWIRVARILSILAVFGGGAGLSFGVQQGDTVICALSVGMGVLLVTLEELLLEYKKQP